MISLKDFLQRRVQNYVEHNFYSYQLFYLGWRFTICINRYPKIIDWLGFSLGIIIENDYPKGYVYNNSLSWTLEILHNMPSIKWCQSLYFILFLMIQIISYKQTRLSQYSKLVQSSLHSVRETAKKHALLTLTTNLTTGFLLSLISIS